MAWQNLLPSFNASALEVWLYFFLLLLLALGFAAWLLLPFSLLRLRPLLRELLAESRRTNKLLEEALRPSTPAQLEPTLEPLEPTLDGGRKGACPNCEAVIPLAALKCPRCGVRLGSGAARTISPLRQSAD